MKENLAKLYSGIYTIVYVDDARKYKYCGDDGSSSKCIIDILDVENVVGDLNACNIECDKRIKGDRISIGWIDSEEYVERTSKLLNGYRGDNMLIFLKEIQPDEYYMIYVRIIIPSSKDSGTFAIVSLHKAHCNDRQYLYLNTKGDILKEKVNLSDLYNGVLNICVCENVYKSAVKTGFDKEYRQIYCDEFSNWCIPHKRFVSKFNSACKKYNNDHYHQADFLPPWQCKQIYQFRPDLLTTFQRTYVEKYSSLGIDRYTVNESSAYDLIKKILVFLDESEKRNFYLHNYKLDWLNGFEGVDNNIQFYKLLKKIKAKDFKNYEQVIVDGRTKGYILVFHDSERYFLCEKKSGKMKQYELHFFVNADGGLSDGDADVYVSIHFIN